MLPKEMYQAINKGVPNNIKLELSTDTLIKSCSSDQAKTLTSMRKLRGDYESVISMITGYNKSNHEFFNNLRLITNYKNSETSIYVSPVCFIERLKEILGITNPSNDLDDPELIEDFNKKLEILDNIEDLDELMITFPIIFKDYQYSLNFADEVKQS